MHRADGHLEPPGEVASGQPAVGLQQQEGGEKPIGSHES
jgi:hypothetical protein